MNINVINEPTYLQKWYSYEYVGPEDIFHPVHFVGDGGPENQPFIWADDSMWSIDTPESPHSILPLLFYGIDMLNPPIDLIGKEIEFYLQGQNLDLKGGSCLFWILSNFPASNRWHLISSPLLIAKGKWEKPNSLVITDNPDHWHNSYCKVQCTPPSLEKTLKNVTSMGISFIDFSEKVTGRLLLGGFHIKNLKKYPPNWPYSIGKNKINRGWLSVSCHTNKQTDAEVVPFTGRDEQGNCVNQQSIVCQNNFVLFNATHTSFVYLAFVHTENATKNHDLTNAVLQFYLHGIDLDLKQGSIHFFIEDMASDTRWIFKNKIQPTSKSMFILTEKDNYWFRLTGKSPLAQVMKQYDYFGFMIVSAQSIPTGTLCLLDFSIGPNFKFNI